MFKTHDKVRVRGNVPLHRPSGLKYGEIYTVGDVDLRVAEFPEILLVELPGIWFGGSLFDIVMSQDDVETILELVKEDKAMNTSGMIGPEFEASRSGNRMPLPVPEASPVGKMVEKELMPEILIGIIPQADGGFEYRVDCGTKHACGYRDNLGNAIDIAMAESASMFNRFNKGK